MGEREGVGMFEEEMGDEGDGALGWGGGVGCAGYWGGA